MLKQYIINGMQWQYEEGEQPAGAVELKPKQKKAEEQPAKAVKKPANKKRGVKNK